MAEREVISLDVDFTKKATVFRKADGSIWLHYCDTKGEWRDVPISLIGLGDLLGSRVTLSGLQSNLAEPKDINRLITSLYPTGRVIYQDGFEERAIGSYAYAGDTGYVAELYTAKSFQGSKCFHIQAPAGGEARIMYFSGLPPNKKIGVEYWIQVMPATNLDNFRVELWAYDQNEMGQVRRVDAMMRFVKTDFNATYNWLKGYWQIWQKPGTWFTIIDPYYINTRSQSWNYVKLIVDFATEKYVKAIIGEKILDLPYDISTVTTENEPNILVTRVRVFAAATGVQDLYVDNHIITTHES